MQILNGGVKDVAAGNENTMVLKQDGSLWATGLNNEGQLGDGTPSSQTFAIKIGGFKKIIDAGVKAMSMGKSHSMVLKQDGSLWAAGYNGGGQLGDGTQNRRSKFVKVVASGVNEVSTGYTHSIYVNDKNELCVTGRNEQGQLGTGDKKTVYKFKCRPLPGKP